MSFEGRRKTKSFLSHLLKSFLGLCCYLGRQRGSKISVKAVSRAFVASFVSNKGLWIEVGVMGHFSTQIRHHGD